MAGRDEEEAIVVVGDEVVQEEAKAGTVSIAVILPAKGTQAGVNEVAVGTQRDHTKATKKEVRLRLFTSKLCLRIVHRFLMLRVCNIRTKPIVKIVRLL